MTGAFTVLAGEPRAPHVHVVRPLRRETPPEHEELGRQLQRKLRRLQQQQRSQRPPAEPEERPRFVTTVRCGQFLPPPPPLAALLGLDSLYPPPAAADRVVYSYVSRPQPVAARARRDAPPPAAALANVRALLAGVAGVSRFLDNRHGGGAAARGRGAAKRGPHTQHAGTDVGDDGDGTAGVDTRAGRAARTRRLALARRVAAARLRARTPPPAPGRRHHPVQTNRYLEELFDAGTESEVACQTDAFEDRPATPRYVPAKTGADAATQIYPGDLFDFDVEVCPIVEVLVGKTTEQALAEVAQEEELAALREQRRRYTELRDAERAERRRLAYQDHRLWEEKERRVSEAVAAQEAALEARERAAAATLVRGYVAELLPGVLAGLRDQGFLVERVRRGVDEEFMPWLSEQVAREVESLITSRDLITEIVREVVEMRHSAYCALGEVGRVSPPESESPRSVGSEFAEEEDQDPMLNI